MTDHPFHPQPGSRMCVCGERDTAHDMRTPIERAAREVPANEECDCTWTLTDGKASSVCNQCLSDAANILTAALSDEAAVLNMIREAITSASASGRTIDDPLLAAGSVVVALRTYLLGEDWT